MRERGSGSRGGNELGHGCPQRVDVEVGVAEARAGQGRRHLTLPPDLQHQLLLQRQDEADGLVDHLLLPQLARPGDHASQLLHLLPFLTFAVLAYDPPCGPNLVRGREVLWPHQLLGRQDGAAHGGLYTHHNHVNNQIERAFWFDAG